MNRSSPSTATSSGRDDGETALDRLTQHWDDAKMDFLLLAQSKAKAVGHDKGEDHLFIKPENTIGWNAARRALHHFRHRHFSSARAAGCAGRKILRENSLAPRAGAKPPVLPAASRPLVPNRHDCGHPQDRGGTEKVQSLSCWLRRVEKGHEFNFTFCVFNFIFSILILLAAAAAFRYREISYMEPQGDIALIGLAVMGQNLILNMNDHGFTVVAYNRTTEKVDHFLANEAKGTQSHRRAFHRGNGFQAQEAAPRDDARQGRQTGGRFHRAAHPASRSPATSSLTAAIRCSTTPTAA